MNEQKKDLAVLDREVREWIADPHKFFKAFSRTAKRFQHTHPSPRYRVMTLVGKPVEFLSRRPMRVNMLGKIVHVRSWSDVFGVVVGIVVDAKPQLMRELDARGMIPWIVKMNPGDDVVNAFNAGNVTLQIDSLESAFMMTQWIALMADVKLNDVIVQVDSFTDEEWRVREKELEAKREEEKRVLREIDLARKQWAEEHGEVSSSEGAFGGDGSDDEMIW